MIIEKKRTEKSHTLLKKQQRRIQKEAPTHTSSSTNTRENTKNLIKLSALQNRFPKLTRGDVCGYALEETLRLVYPRLRGRARFIFHTPTRI